MRLPGPLIAALLILSAGLGPFLLPGRTLAQNQARVAEVEITGNKALSSGKIKNVMEIQTKGWKVWSKAQVLDRSALKRDQEAIVQLYRNEGYYLAEVEVSAREEGQKALIKVEIQEGEPVRIRQVEVDLSAFDPDPPVQLSSLPGRFLVKGEIFRLEDYRQVKNEMVKYLAERSYPKPDLEAQARVSAKGGWADVSFKLSPGPSLVMGPVTFEGHHRTRTEVLVKEIPWQGGEPFQLSLLNELQRRLIDLGVFSSVRVEALLDQIKSAQDGQAAPIMVKLVERKARSVEVGVGFGSEDKLRARGALSIRSALGRAEVFSIGAHYSSRALGGLISYRQPHFLVHHQTLGLQVGHVDREEVSFSNSRSYGNLDLEREFIGGLTVRYGYLIELNRPHDIQVAHTRQENQEAWASALRLGLSLDSRNDRLDPRKGGLAGLSGEYAPNWLGSEVGYLLLTARAVRYHPLNRWLTLRGRLKATTIQALEPTDSIPIYKRIFAGGNNSIRGYPYQKLGPLDSDGNPLGGRTLIEAGLELRFPLFGPVDGVVFAEAGNLSPDSWSINFSDFRYTAGVGLRVKSIVGPIRFDLGYQLNPPEEADFSRFQIHFNIGQEF